MLLFLGLLLHPSVGPAYARSWQQVASARCKRPVSSSITGTKISVGSHHTAQPLHNAQYAMRGISNCHDQEPTSATSRQPVPAATFSSAPVPPASSSFFGRLAKIFDTTAFCMVGRRAMGLTGGTCSPVRPDQAIIDEIRDNRCSSAIRNQWPDRCFASCP